MKRFGIACVAALLAVAAVVWLTPGRVSADELVGPVMDGVSQPVTDGAKSNNVQLAQWRGGWGYRGYGGFYGGGWGGYYRGGWGGYGYNVYRPYYGGGYGYGYGLGYGGYAPYYSGYSYYQPYYVGGYCY